MIAMGAMDTVDLRLIYVFTETQIPSILHHEKVHHGILPSLQRVKMNTIMDQMLLHRGSNPITVKHMVTFTDLIHRRFCTTMDNWLSRIMSRETEKLRDAARLTLR